MPGFAVYYRYPNSQRVTYGQFIKVSYWLTDNLLLSLELIEWLSSSVFSIPEPLSTSLLSLAYNYIMGNEIMLLVVICSYSFFFTFTKHCISCLKVHWKWSQRITRLLIQCLESTEYMEIRNALIMLTKISSVFPVTRKSGINLEKRVNCVIQIYSSTSFPRPALC